MNAEQLYEQLKKFQESKGYFFNKDKKMVLALLESLLVNKKRYGHMACPCRLASGDYEQDRDIVCPCVYREADVKEYGTCFCGLYVSEDWNQETIPHEVVPERRNPAKVLAGLGM
ncbi:MAG: ferredoxin-thioredoxin reductase catalytic domain-containing protein [Desulfoplanes sp.]|nr:ferredoxin-thioredoxin reductase catalytic domain-containing protein [Desulfoplanes sp.]MDD4649116.1 ferredoxin-thioredoxin reductase catalytic domain-containing protein [Desulfoplanes sp.]